MTKMQECEKIYTEAFGENPRFDKLLFDFYFKNIETFSVNGKVASMLFKIPCLIKTEKEKKKASYIYAVATEKNMRGKGYMSALINRVCTDDEICFLRAAKPELVPFYERLGFRKTDATPNAAAVKIECEANHKKISALCDIPTSDYTLMVKGALQIDIEKIQFKHTLE